MAVLLCPRHAWLDPFPVQPPSPPELLHIQIPALHPVPLHEGGVPTEHHHPGRHPNLGPAPRPYLLGVGHGNVEQVFDAVFRDDAENGEAVEVFVVVVAPPALGDRKEDRAGSAQHPEGLVVVLDLAAGVGVDGIFDDVPVQQFDILEVRHVEHRHRQTQIEPGDVVRLLPDRHQQLRPVVAPRVQVSSVSRDFEFARDEGIQGIRQVQHVQRIGDLKRDDEGVVV
eukprot:CAMPEP_0183301520 /NCGR_PEP_ID=MMETSP0160_2-20130417/7611_1 /TAXON_ID=2839 ORGANISM="Odontella Sinensis, Strain Grunow 1884" /NCGR_SAMPLE_ID=MMETSP0160_2 /ASSEMBLY_ACC=CAM_ASM_000250 /LENGTH=225 /DNA_ID=CAMNT_0025464157 /DNA_START=170 /DNA_END=843 /DNA_ORIENTATION=-